MTPDMEMQLIAAIVHTGDISTPRRLGLTPEYLQYVPAQHALSVILGYVDGTSTRGAPPGIAYLAERAVSVPEYLVSSGDLASLCDAVRLNKLRMQILQLAQEVGRTAVDDPMEAYNRLQALALSNDMSSLVSSGESSSLAWDFERIIRDYDATVHNQGVTGESTPFPTLTAATKGWQRGGFYVVYAPAKNYKTFVALSVVADLYTRRRRTLVVSSEMSHRQMNERLLCMILGLDFNHFLNRTLPTDVYEAMCEEAETFRARASTTIHHFSPSGLGAKAVNEVRAKIQELNSDGELALVLWDGHYRSSKSDNWEDVYDLTRRTRAIPMDSTTGEVPMLITTQAGSKRGEVAYRVYEQEASVLMQLAKEGAGQAVLWTKAIRQGLGCRIRLEIDLTRGSIHEAEVLPTEDFDGMQVY